MPIPFPSVQDSHSATREQMWSKSERAIARKALNRALNQELQELIEQAKQMAAAIKLPSELWELERHLTERRKKIDRKYSTGTRSSRSCSGRRAPRSSGCNSDREEN